ncbi:MAG: FkbM family methyltransferase [Desulfovibrio sp.]|jgi:hypothetical protein|nr:FkbM family methyltransferase [Desulfovibrio sp.]
MTSNKNELQKFYLNGTLSTFDEETVNRIGRELYTEISLETRTLNDILSRHDIHDIHFLKIDAEKHEQYVLEGFDLKKYLPWILCIEATLPKTRIECHNEWEQYVLESGYTFVTKFSANRYYLANKYKKELMENFIAKPCVYFMRRPFINYLKKVFLWQNIPFFK